MEPNETAARHDPSFILFFMIKTNCRVNGVIYSEGKQKEAGEVKTSATL